MPALEDLEYLYSEAAKQPGQLIELPWFLNQEHYVLTAKLERRTSEQGHQWSFYRGHGLNCKLEWNYESSDILMVHSLVMTAFPGETHSSDPSVLKNIERAADGEHRRQVLPEQPAAPPSPARMVRGVLEGSLADMPLPSLLNSIQSSHLTGRLAIHSHDETADLFFEEGNLVDARRPNQEGEEAFIEVALNSAIGDFKFFNSDKSPKKTIKGRHLDGLMLKAAALTDHTRFLDRQGLKPNSVLIRAVPNISEQEFETRVANLVPVDMSLQKRMYQAVDNQTLFADLIKQCSLTRSLWTPLIFNLVSSGIVNIENKTVEDVPPQMAQDLTGSHLTIDLIALERFTASMMRRDTGIYTEIAFLFFLEHEFYRFHSYENPFTIALFRLAQPQAGPQSELLMGALDVVKAAVRKADILGHYEGDDYALILPHTEPRAAASLIARLKSVLKEPPFGPGEIELSIGIAGIPEDCQDLIGLLKIARFRKKNLS